VLVVSPTHKALAITQAIDLFNPAVASGLLCPESSGYAVEHDPQRDALPVPFFDLSEIVGRDVSGATLPTKEEGLDLIAVSF
jgi:hypothetical protein